MAAKKIETLCILCKTTWKPEEWEDYTSICDPCLSKKKLFCFFKKQIDSIKYSKSTPEIVVTPLPVVLSLPVETEKKTPTRDPLYQYINVEKSD